MNGDQLPLLIRGMTPFPGHCRWLRPTDSVDLQTDSVRWAGMIPILQPKTPSVSRVEVTYSRWHSIERLSEFEPKSCVLSPFLFSQDKGPTTTLHRGDTSESPPCSMGPH